MHDIELKASWAKKHGLRESTGHPCLARLVGKSCWVYRDARFKKKAEEIDCDVPKADHTSLWTKGGRAAAYVMQPYGISSRTMDWVYAFCRKYGLKLMISTDQSWHFPGKSTMLVIYRNGALSESK
jgi:hypothetical protein